MIVMIFVVAVHGWAQTPGVHLHQLFGVHFMVIVKCAEVNMYAVHVHIVTQMYVSPFSESS